MSEDIIYIEADEEITSVVDKLHKASGKEIVLVVPRGAVVLTSLVNLKLLQREAANTNKKIGIVTADQIGRKLAHQAGIAILDSVEHKRVLIEPKGAMQEKLPEEVDLTKSQKPGVKVHHFQEGKETFETKEVDVTPAITEHEPLPRVVAAPITKKRSKKALYIFLILVVVALVAGVVFIPSAQVKLLVAGESFERDLEIQVSTSENVPSVDEASIPGDFTDGETEVSESFSAAGTKNVGEKAKGQATISNDAGVDQTLPANAKLSGGGLNFLTTSEVTVPKATLNVAGDKIAGKATVAVEAEQAGDRYNVTNLNVSVPKDKLSGKIDQASGGSTKEITVVAAQDIAAAKATLEKKALDQLKTELAKKSNKIIMDGAINFEATQVSTSVPEGSEVTNFEMKLMGKAKALVFQEAEFRETYLTILRSGLPPDKDLVFSPSDEIVTQVVEADLTTGKMTIKGTIKTQLVQKLNTGVIRKELVAQTLDQASEHLRELEDIKRAEVNIAPAWFKRLPLVAARIKVSIEHE